MTWNQSGQGALSSDLVPTVMKDEKRLAGHKSPDDLCLDLSLCQLLTQIPPLMQSKHRLAG